ncbi:MAG TPA: hypothetical protein VIX81_07345, partial [Gammaproteobacteria bacterium]
DSSLYQPALSCDSVSSWKFLHRAWTNACSTRPRNVPLVEVMAPVFSQMALNKCREYFAESESGWGLDILWSSPVFGLQPSVFDCIQMKHLRPLRSSSWQLENGLTPPQELAMMIAKFKLRPPADDYGMHWFDKFGLRLCQSYKNLGSNLRETAR